MAFFNKVAKLESEKQPFALCSIIEASTHSPGRQNFKMCVPANSDTFGSIGGGALEYDATIKARDLLKNNEQSTILEMTLTEKELGGIGMACGGNVKVYIECFYPKDTLYIFGGGHIGGTLANFASKVGFDPVIIDNRPDFANIVRHPDCSETHCLEYDDATKILNYVPNAYYVIVTHKHIGDDAVLRGLLMRENLQPKYLGLIGSAKKLARVFKQMIADGFDENILHSVHAPIGVDHGGQTAPEIALAIATQIVAARYDIQLKDDIALKKNPWTFMKENENV